MVHVSSFGPATRPGAKGVKGGPNRPPNLNQPPPPSPPMGGSYLPFQRRNQVSLVIWVSLYGEYSEGGVWWNVVEEGGVVGWWAVGRVRGWSRLELRVVVVRVACVFDPFGIEGAASARKKRPHPFGDAAMAQVGRRSI